MGFFLFLKFMFFVRFLAAFNDFSQLTFPHVSILTINRNPPGKVKTGPFTVLFSAKTDSVHQ